MKIFLIVTCLLATAAAISTENRNKLAEAWKGQTGKCGKQNGFNNMTLQEIYKKEERDGVGKSTCFHACLLRSLGMIRFSQIDRQKLGDYIDSMFAEQPQVATDLKQAAIHCVAEVTNIQEECKMAYFYGHCFLNSN